MQGADAESSSTKVTSDLGANSVKNVLCPNFVERNVLRRVGTLETQQGKQVNG